MSGSCVKLKGQILHSLHKQLSFMEEFNSEPLELLIWMKAILSLIWKVFHGWNMFRRGTGQEIFLPHSCLERDEVTGSNMVTLSMGIMAW